MGRRIIKIGSEYEKAFESICILFKNGFISKRIVSDVSLDNTRIISEENNCEYVYSKEFKTIESDQKIEINSSGATWFKSIREKTDVDFGSSSWLSLIEKVSSDFHKANSFLEFDEKEAHLDLEAEKLHHSSISEFMKEFYPGINYTLKNGDANSAIDDVYGISMLTELDAGTGETQKVLSKIFYRRKGYKFKLLTALESKEIIDQIYEVIDNGDNNNEENTITDSAIIEQILTELEKTIESRHFTESVVLNSDRDKKIISHFLEKGPQHYVEINCRNVKILGIYHVKWHNYPYNLYVNNELFLRVIFDLKKRMSMYCMHCSIDETPIVEENKIFYLDNGNISFYTLSLNEENFGLTIDEINNIKCNGEIKNHLIIMKHNAFSRLKKGCKKYVCRNEIVEIGGEKFCKSCPYPEIIYRLEDGSLYPTSKLIFARDKLTLLKQDEVKRCKCCKRTFSIQSIKRNRCKLCNRIESIASNDSLNVFDKYKEYFPLTKRLLLKGKCVAIEDEDIILFKLGEKKYIVNKIDIDDEGFVENPKEIE